MNWVDGLTIANWVIVFQSFLIASLLLILWIYLPMFWGAPWIPIGLRTADRMLRMAEVHPGQTVVDLGAGDGRMVILAARKYKARVKGVEIDPLRVLAANLGIRMFGLRGKAHVRWGNLHRFDFTGADVVTLFLMQGTNQTLKDRLEKTLRPGAKVVSHLFSMSGWTPVALDDRHGIFVYEIGNTTGEIETKFY
jgi:SAM-dependent methyltransferase